MQRHLALAIKRGRDVEAKRVLDDPHARDACWRLD